MCIRDRVVVVAAPGSALGQNQLGTGRDHQILLVDPQTAACFLDSLATLNLPGDGVGLRYHFGLFLSLIHIWWPG